MNFKILKIHELSRILKCQRISKIKFAVMNYSKKNGNLPCKPTNTRTSADADNGLDAFVGQSRSTNISGPFQVK